MNRERKMLERLVRYHDTAPKTYLLHQHYIEIDDILSQPEAECAPTNAPTPYAYATPDGRLELAENKQYADHPEDFTVPLYSGRPIIKATHSGQTLVTIEGDAPTPETDDFIRYWISVYEDPTSGDHFRGHAALLKIAKQLKTERDAARAELARLASETDAQVSKSDYWRRKLAEVGGMDNELVNVPASGVRKIIDDLAKAERQRDVALAECDRLRKACSEYNSALSRCAYLASEPNEMEASWYDVEPYPQNAVDAVEKMRSKLNAALAERAQRPSQDDEEMRQIIHALQRAKEDNEQLAKKLMAARDYSADIPMSDAEFIGKAIELLEHNLAADKEKPTKPILDGK